MWWLDLRSGQPNKCVRYRNKEIEIKYLVVDFLFPDEVKPDWALPVILKWMSETHSHLGPELIWTHDLSEGEPMHNLVTWASDLRKYNESGKSETLWTELE